MKLTLALFGSFWFTTLRTCHSQERLSPTVFISILVRNKEHTLPHFLGNLERLDYPKDRITLWFKSDHNIDQSIDILNTWIALNKDLYHKVDLHVDTISRFLDDEDGVFDWSPRHFAHIIALREESLKEARKRWADYILFLDCDAFLTNPNTLQTLVEQNKCLIAPMLESLGAYSNYWCGMNDKGYYKRTDDYRPILEREKLGVFEVPMIHTAVLLDLHCKQSQQLTFDPTRLTNYSGPMDDIIVFAHSANYTELKMYVINTLYFGYMMSPMEPGQTLEEDKQQLINLRIEVMAEDYPLYVSPSLKHFLTYKTPDTLGFDKLYLINLERRYDRRERMEDTFKELGLKVNLISGVDGKNLTEADLEKLGVKMLPGYQDPIKKRPLTLGEIGCFLSHYSIWKEMVDQQLQRVVVFEDDLRFNMNFRDNVRQLLGEVTKLKLSWDLIYLGRKRLAERAEPYVMGTTKLVHVDYSYWTLCYILTLEGAKKLVGADPLGKMVPVDEFLPIMYDKHPDESWKKFFPSRNLQAFSAYPLLVHPTHYTGDEKYVSDTEDSILLSSTTFPSFPSENPILKTTKTSSLSVSASVFSTENEDRSVSLSSITPSSKPSHPGASQTSQLLESSNNHLDSSMSTARPSTSMKNEL